jgi:hypothetical protein
VLNIHIVNHDENLKKGEVCCFALGTWYDKYNKAVDNTGERRLAFYTSPLYKWILILFKTYAIISYMI